jgi:hypothetical protein
MKWALVQYWMGTVTIILIGHGTNYFFRQMES